MDKCPICGNEATRLIVAVDGTDVPWTTRCNAHVDGVVAFLMGQTGIQLTHIPHMDLFRSFGDDGL